MEHPRHENEFRAFAHGDADSESDREDAWLAAIQYTPGKERVCFEFANIGDHRTTVINHGKKKP